MKKIACVIAALSLCQAPAMAAAVGTGSYSLQLHVAETCTIQHTPGLSPAGGGAYNLGAIKEYCNAPRGYDVVVTYTPGTMKGATIALGGDAVTLNGSGTAIVSHAAGPRILDRELVVTPGASGFDTDVLSFQTISN